MINTINEAINRKLNSISFTTIIKGTVESLEPLKIRISDKIVIGLSFIEPRSLGIDGSSPSSALPLVVGEEIEMVRYNNGQRFYVLGKAINFNTINIDYKKQVYNKPSLDTTSNKALNPLKEEINGEIVLNKIAKTGNFSDLLNKPKLNTNNNTSLAINSAEEIKDIIKLHKIAKTGSYKDLLYKPIIPITFTDNMKSDYSISELPGWQVNLLQQMIDEYLQDNDSINNYILRADGIQYLEDSDSTFDTSMNYGKTDSLFTFKKVGSYGSIPHAFQFVGSIIVNQSISKDNGYSNVYFRKNGIMIYCDKNYKITDVCQRYQLYGGDKDTQGFGAYYISTNDSYTTAYIPTQDYQPATKKYVDDTNRETEVNLLEKINQNADNITFLKTQKILWEGAWFMQGTQTANLSEKISEQPHGIVLVFSEYASGAAQDYNFSCHFVPKEFVSLYSGYGSSFFLNNSKLGLVGSKYLYIRDNNISGNAANIETGTGASGIKYTNNRWVLRAIIGV